MVCVLLQTDGQYHLERHTIDKVHVREGRITAAELKDLVHALDSDAFSQLDQKQIPNLMLKSDADRIMLDVHRLRGWQQLSFPDSASREPFRAVMDPLLKWFVSLGRRKARKMSEEAGRNNCLPPSGTEFARRDAPRFKQPSPATAGTASAPPEVPAAAQSSFTLLMFEDRQVSFEPEVRCLLISPGGAFHLVRQSRTWKNGLRNFVLDGQLSPPQLETLRAILNHPALAGDHDDLPAGDIIMTPDGFYTRLFIPRGLATQKLASWKSYRITNQVLSRDVEEHGLREMEPLRRWLKDNIDEKAAIQVPVPANPRCTPGQ